MKLAAGYGVWSDRDSDKQLELDTCRCNHCQRHIWVKPNTGQSIYLIPDLTQPSQWREEPGAFCRLCMKPVCLRCDAKGRCMPFEAKLERAEARDRLARQALGDYR